MDVIRAILDGIAIAAIFNSAVVICTQNPGHML